MEHLQTWQERQLNGDVFKTEDLRSICEEPGKNPEMQISPTHYLQFLMLLVQSHESRQDFLIGLPKETVETHIRLAEPKEPAPPEVIYLQTA
jgi:hypothetical protein